MPDQEQDQQIGLDEWERRTFEKFGVPENLRRSILGQESADGTRLTSPTGVKGRYQVTRATAKKHGYDRDDPWQQPVAAAKEMRTLYDGVKKRYPGFSDKQAWLGASAEYYYGADAFDKDGNLSTGSRDGRSTPAKYATSIAEKWSAFDRDGTPQDTQPVTQGSLPQYDSQGRRKIGARDVGVTPAEGMRFDLVGGASRTTPKPTPRGAPQLPVGQRKLSSVGPRVGAQPAPGSFEEARANVSRLTSQISPETQERLRKIEEFERQPLATQVSERAYDALARGGAELSRLGRRAAGAVVGLAASPITGKLEMAELRPEAIRKWEEERARELAERQQRYRPSLASEIGEGILEGAPVAAAGALIGAATGGGIVPTLATGGGLAAAGADWSDPKRAAAQTALGAVAPVVGGRFGAGVAGRVAGRLASPSAQTAARMTGEIGGGAAGNVLQSGAEQLAFEGQISPREMVKQAVIGGALSAPGALMVAGRPSRADQYRAELEAAPAQDPAMRAVAQADEGMTSQFREQAQRQAFALMGLSPEQIDAEIARLRPQQPQPALEAQADPIRQALTQAAPLSASEQKAQERARLYEVSRNVAGRSMDAAQAAIDTGDFAEAQAQIAAGQRALRDALRFAPADAPGERARLAREVTRAGAMLTDAKRQATAQRRIENQPTRGITAPRPQPSAQASEQPQARASSPLLSSVVNPEGGIPQAPEALSGRFGAMARQQAAQVEAAPRPRRKDTGQLSPIEYLKRKTRGQGIRVSDRGEAAVLGAKEAGIVGLTNRRSKWTANDAAVMLDEGGFTLADGRRFTDPSVAENDVLEFLGVSGKQGRMDTSALDQRLADEEAEYYAGQADVEPTPQVPQRRTPPAPLSPRRPGQRAGIPEPGQRRSETGALEEVGDFFGEMREQEAPVTTAATDPNLATAYRKLRTDDPEVISQLLRDADKRFKKSATPEEAQASAAAWAKVQRLTPDEQQALSGVIPERTFAPVRAEYEGKLGERYGRSVEDISTSEPNAQLDRNLDDLLSFFDEVTDKPKLKIVADAAQRLKDAASGKRAGSGAEQLVDLTIVAGWKAYRAGMDFATWSREVIRDAGERVRPHLKRVWKELTESFSVGPLPRTRADVERSPRFRSWFGESKVTDEKGNPLVVYHGTPGSFETFDKSKIKEGGSLGPGFYIAENPYEAMQYIRGYNVGEDVNKAPNIMPLYLSMQKPLDVEAPLLDRAKVARLIPEDAEYLPDTDKVSYFEVIDAVGDVTSQDVAKKLGYDGLVISSSAGRVWVAFEPTQIKSATGNRGTFDTSTGSILSGGLGSLQGMFESGRRKTTEGEKEGPGLRGRVSETVGGLQTAAQLGNPRFVIRNVLQHVAFGKQERGAMRLAATMDWAISKATGKGRQITARVAVISLPMFATGGKR